MICMKRVEKKTELRVLLQHLDNAVTFERLATEEANHELQEAFVKQARSYRNLASRYAEKLGLPAPSPSALFVD
jgi:hypothetical protein